MRLGSLLTLFADVVEHRGQPDKPACNQGGSHPVMTIHGELIGAIECAQAQHKRHHLANVLDANGSPYCSHLNFTRVLALLLCHANDSLGAARNDMVKLGKHVR